MYQKNLNKTVNLINLISFNKIQIKAFICVFLISLLSLLSLIQANVLYIDDITRVLSGNPNWEPVGRPLSNLVTELIQLGKPLTDISPLSQILSVALYSVSSIYLGKVFRVNNLVFLTLGGVAFVLNPFNLQNFSYVFDSFTMGLAVFSSTLAFFLISTALEKPLSSSQKFLLFALTLFLLISSLCLYQAATSIYIAAFTFYSLLKLVKSETIKQSLKVFIFSTIILFVSLVAYLPIKNFYSLGGFAQKQSQIPSLREIPETFLSNLIYSVKYLYQSLGKSSLLFLIFILGLLVILSLIIINFNQFKKNTRNLPILINLLTIITLTLFYLISLIVSFYGLSLVFINTHFQPRVFMGFSAVVGISCFFLAHLFSSCSHLKFLRYFLIFFLCLLCLSFTNVSLTYGNILYYQNTYEERIATVLLSDLEEEISKLYNLSKEPKIVIANQLEYSSLTFQAFKKYPILKEITRSYFRQGWFHSYQKLRSLGFKLNPSQGIGFIPKEEKFFPSFQPILSRRMYDIYLENNDTFIILFKNKS